jgi:hypothetical protein
MWVGDGAKLTHVYVQKIPASGAWRVMASVKADGTGRPVEMRCFLRREGHPLTADLVLSMAAVNDGGLGSSPVLLPGAFRPRSGTMEQWNAAYVRVEDYLRAHRIHNRLHQSRLIQAALERAAVRHEARSRR